MELRRFHRPRWSDICDECDEEACICGKQSNVEQCCECSQDREDILAMLKELRITKLERFKGVFQKDHEPCKSCTKYVYDRLKQEKARQSLTKPRSRKLCKPVSEPALPMPNPQTFRCARCPSTVKPGRVKGIEMIEPIENGAAILDSNKTIKLSLARATGAADLESNKTITLSLARATARPKSRHGHRNDLNQMQYSHSSGSAPPVFLLNAAYAATLWCAWQASVPYCHNV